MKKVIVSMVMVIAMTFVFCACGAQSTPAEDVNESDTVVEETTEPTEEAVDVMTGGEMANMLNDISKENSDVYLGYWEFVTLDDGQEGYVFHVADEPLLIIISDDVDQTQKNELMHSITEYCMNAMGLAEAGTKKDCIGIMVASDNTPIIGFTDSEWQVLDD